MRCVRFLLVIVFLFFAPALSLAVDDSIVAKVGDVPIVDFEVDARASAIMPFNVSYHGTVTDEKKKEVLEKALSELVLRAYKICYAKSLELEIAEEQIEEKIGKFKAQFTTVKEFEAAVKGMTIEGLRASIRRDYLAKKGEELAVNSKVNISEDQVKAYYEENKHTFLKPKQFRASQIMIKVDPAATKDVRDELRQKAEGLMEKAKAGEDFHNLAYYNSDDRTSYVGGDMGMFHEGQAGKKIDEALLKLEVDGVSDIVEELDGFHIFKLTQVIESRQMTFDEMGPKIRTLLETKQREALYEEWMENLKIAYKVERFDS